MGAVLLKAMGICASGDGSHKVSIQVRVRGQVGVRTILVSGSSTVAEFREQLLELTDEGFISRGLKCHAVYMNGKKITDEEQTMEHVHSTSPPAGCLLEVQLGANVPWDPARPVTISPASGAEYGLTNWHGTTSRANRVALYKMQAGEPTEHAWTFNPEAAGGMIRFGANSAWVVSLFGGAVEPQTIELECASKLPATGLLGEAFNGNFAYDIPTGEIYVATDRQLVLATSTPAENGNPVRVCRSSELSSGMTARWEVINCE